VNAPEEPERQAAGEPAKGPLFVSFRGSVDKMAGRCWCGRTYASADPVDMWVWLEEHDHQEPSDVSPESPMSPVSALSVESSA
jgi:hypothetical protein